jgi:hypothetical protein
MPVHYLDGKIYQLINDVNDIIYVGATAQLKLCSRRCGHVRASKDVTNKSPLYTAMRAIGTDHFRMVLDHAFPCASKDELYAEEMKTLDALIAAGKQFYNSTVGGKLGAAHVAKMAAANTGKVCTDAAKAKIAAAHVGKHHTDAAKAKVAEARFSYGSITRQPQGNNFKWVFVWSVGGKQHANCKSFSCHKYGEYGAHWRADEARRQIYPEWGNEEDCTCDDLGEIEWD